MILGLIGVGMSICALGISIYTQEHIIKSNFIEVSNLELELGRKESCIENRNDFIGKQKEQLDTLKNNVESFKMDFENITKGKRKPEDMLKKIIESYYLYIDNNSNYTN